MKLIFEHLTDTKQQWIKENPVLFGYLRKGFFQTEQDIDNLHQFHSPFIVPKGLTKLQIRRRINNFRKNGNPNQDPFAKTHRVNISVDGKFLSSTIYNKPITNNRQYIAFLKELINVLRAPKRKLSDKELL